jgi:hypothetical protein
MAYELGTKKTDHILIARARILSSRVEASMCDAEGTEVGVRPGSHAERARTYSEEAIQYAMRTQNTRLIARGQISLAIARLYESDDNVDPAEDLLKEAQSNLKVPGGDYVFDDLKTLQQLLERARAAHEKAKIPVAG